MKGNRGDRSKTESFQDEVQRHEPERPKEAWTCECGQQIPPGTYFCQHNAPPEIERLEIAGAFSSDMKPRIRRR